MNGFLLDTNVPSETLRLVPDVKVSAWLQSCRQESQFLSVVTLGEFRRGTTLLPRSARRTQLENFIESPVPAWFGHRILPVAERWGIFCGNRQLTGRPLSTADGLIAATALEHHLALVTRNGRDFEDLGVNLINPWLAGS